jgi:hypothetical protein
MIGTLRARGRQPLVSPQSRYTPKLTCLTNAGKWYDNTQLKTLLPSWGVSLDTSGNRHPSNSHIDHCASPLKQENPHADIIIRALLGGERDRKMSDGGSQSQSQPDPKDARVEPTGDSLGAMGPSAFHRSEEEDPIEGFFL